MTQEAGRWSRWPVGRSVRVLRAHQIRAASRTVGVVSGHLVGGVFGSRMLEGVRVAARERDHLLVVPDTGGDPDLAGRLVEEMLDRPGAGRLPTSC